MAKAEIKSGVIGPTKEEVESLTGKGAGEGLIPWIPGKWKKGITTALGLATAGGVGAGIGVAAFNWYIEHRPAIIEPASAAQISPRPEIVTTEHKGGPEFQRKQERPETIQMPVRSRVYEVKNGNSWKSIAEEQGLLVNLLVAANPEVSLWKQPEAGQTLRIPSPEEGLKDLQAVVEFQIIRDNLEWEEMARIAEAGKRTIKILGEANIFEGQKVITKTIRVGVADDEELARWKEVYGDDRTWGVAYLELGLIYLNPIFLSPRNFDLLTHNVGHEIGHILSQTRHEDFDYPDGWKDDPAIRAGNAISHYLFPLDRFAEQEFSGKVAGVHIKTEISKEKPK